MRRFINILFALVIATVCASAKVAIAPGEWKTMHSYRDITAISPSLDKVYVAASGGVFAYDKKTKEITTLTTLDGLSPSPIITLVYVEEANSLFILHTDMCIDVMTDGKVFTDESLKDKDISGKILNSIKVEGEKVYLSLDAGIVVYNAKKREVFDTYIIGNDGELVKVFQTVENRGDVFALIQDSESEIGKMIKVCRKGNNANDYSAWDTVIPPLGSNIKQMENVNGHVVVLTDAGLFAYLGKDGWVDVSPRGIVPERIQVYKNRCTCLTNWQLMVFHEDNLGNYKYKHCIANLAVYDVDEDVTWIADGGLRMIEMGDPGETSVKSDPILPDGPSQNEYYSIELQGEDVFLAGNNGWATPAVIDYLRDGKWHALRDSMTNEQLRYFRSAECMVVDPQDKDHIFVPTWWGVYEFYKDTLVNIHDKSNASFSEANSASECTITDIAWFDEDNNLIVANPESKGFLLHVMNKDGEWKALRHNSLIGQRYAHRHIKTTSGIDIIPFEYKPCGIGFVDMNGTTWDESDDKTRLISSFKYVEEGVTETFSPIRVYSVEEDLKGDLWIATDQGPIILKNLKGVFDGKETCVRPKVTREDDSRYADYLLSGDKIKRIQVDGKNRKWIATESNGVYLVSANGDKILESFTTKNSPLSSNSIVDIRFDKVSGYLYILTNDGIYIYASDSSLPSEDFDDVVIYPNPVRPDYDGDVEIKGLMEESNVRITDQRGAVIENGLSNGGTYRFSARRNDGTRLPTGVYNIFVTTSPDENGEMVTKHLKFAIIR